jgi:ubiquinone biosynthesis accessory factor UbiK
MPSLKRRDALSFFHFWGAYEGLAPSLTSTTPQTAPSRRAPEQCAPSKCKKHNKGLIMDKPNFLNDLQAKINQAIESSPAKDIEKNMKAMLTQGFSKLDLVTREEFDVQAQVLAKTRAKLEALEARVAELETLLKNP